MSIASSCFLTTILPVLVWALSGTRVFLFAIFTILKPKTECCSSALISSLRGIKSNPRKADDKQRQI